jgi:phosphate transport system substrate-binding protein
MVVITVLAIAIACTGCGNGEDDFIGIENISFENYPKVDGSTSAKALSRMVACKLLGIRYDWQLVPLTGMDHAVRPMYVEWTVTPEAKDIPQRYADFFGQQVMTSQTHGAFMNLIDGNADMILTHRTISPDEKEHADAAGVTLIETSIALDAFVFIVSPNNPVKSLTGDEIKKIYTEEITNWSQVGGSDERMDVFTRPRNSGSEEVFRTLVMDGLAPSDFPAIREIG